MPGGGVKVSPILPALGGDQDFLCLLPQAKPDRRPNFLGDHLLGRFEPGFFPSEASPQAKWSWDHLTKGLSQNVRSSISLESSCGEL